MVQIFFCKSSSSDGQAMVPNEKDESSVLVETVTDEEPKVDFKGVVRVRLGQKASKEVESGTQTRTGLRSRGGVMVAGDSNSRYQIALKALAKQQLLLGKVLKISITKLMIRTGELSLRP